MQEPKYLLELPPAAQTITCPISDHCCITHPYTRHVIGVIAIKSGLFCEKPALIPKPCKLQPSSEPQQSSQAIPTSPQAGYGGSPRTGTPILPIGAPNRRRTSCSLRTKTVHDPATISKYSRKWYMHTSRKYIQIHIHTLCTYIYTQRERAPILYPQNPAWNQAISLLEALCNASELASECPKARPKAQSHMAVVTNWASPLWVCL